MRAAESWKLVHLRTSSDSQKRYTGATCAVPHMKILKGTPPGRSLIMDLRPLERTRRQRQLTTRTPLTRIFKVYPPCYPDNRHLAHLHNVDESVEDPAASSSAQPKQTGKKKKKRPRKGATAETPNFSAGDQCLSNDINFLRTTLWYLMLCSAIAEGDIGRTFEVIKVQNLIQYKSSN